MNRSSVTRHARRVADRLPPGAIQPVPSGIHEFAELLNMPAYAYVVRLPDKSGRRFHIGRQVYKKGQPAGPIVYGADWKESYQETSETWLIDIWAVNNTPPFIQLKQNYIFVRIRGLDPPESVAWEQDAVPVPDWLGAHRQTFRLLNTPDRRQFNYDEDVPLALWYERSGAIPAEDLLAFARTTQYAILYYVRFGMTIPSRSEQ
jgi:hypothetical protein